MHAIFMMQSSNVFNPAALITLIAYVSLKNNGPHEVADIWGTGLYVVVPQTRIMLPSTISIPFAKLFFPTATELTY